MTDQPIEPTEPAPEPSPEPLKFEAPTFDYIEKGDNHEGVETRGGEAEHE